MKSDYREGGLSKTFYFSIGEN